MKKIGVSIIVLTVALLIQGCISHADYKSLENKYNTDVAGMNAHIRDLEASNESLSQENQKSSFELRKIQLKVDELEKKAKVDDETISIIREGIVSKLQALAVDGESSLTGNSFNIQGEVLFDPGRADLRQKGKDLLKKLADIVKDEPGYMFQIAGHTDTDPIRESKDLWRTGSNFELAAYRALTVLLFLEQQGVDASRLYLTSYGEYRPKSDKKAENRRVEISFIKMPAEKKEIGSEEKKPQEPVPSK